MNNAIPLTNLTALAVQFRRAFPEAEVSATANFIANAVRAAERPVPALAQDAMPIGLGGHNMPSGSFKRRLTRDQLFERNDDLGVRPDQITKGSRFIPGRTVPADDQDDPDNGSPDYTSSIDPATAGDFVRLLCSRFATSDPELHDQFVDELQKIIGEENPFTGDGNRRRRVAGRDQNYGRRTPAGGISSFNGRGSMDQVRGSYNARSPGNGIGSYGRGATGSPTASDSAYGVVDRINRSGFEARWGSITRHIKLNADGRY